MYYDDEEINVSTSSREFIESPAKARREALRNKLKKEGIKNKNTRGLKLAVLKQQVEGRQSSVQQRDEAKTEEQGSSTGTKTREQEIRTEQQTADEKLSAEQLVKQGQAQAKAEEEMKKEEVATEEG